MNGPYIVIVLQMNIIHSGEVNFPEQSLSRYPYDLARNERLDINVIKNRPMVKPSNPRTETEWDMDKTRKKRLSKNT